MALPRPADPYGRRLLLTGGSGLLALNWARVMAGQGWEVHRTIHRQPAPLDGSPTHKIDLAGDDFAQLLDEIEPALVVHTAALTNVDRCETEPDLAFRANAELARSVARACASAGVALTHISTDHLWQGTQAMTAEDVRVAPLNAYARSKAAGEVAVLEEHPGGIVARTNFYGWGTAYRNSFSDWIIGRLRKSERTTLFADSTYTPILIDPLVTAVHELVERRAAGIFNLVSDDAITKHAFGILLAEVFGLDPAPIVATAMPEGTGAVPRPKDMSLSNRKVVAALGRPLGTVRSHVEMLARLEHDPVVRAIRALKAV